MRVLPITILASLTTLVALGSLGLACGGGGSGGAHPSTSNDASSEVTTQPSPESGGGNDGGAAEAAVEAGYPALVPTDVPQVLSRGGSVMATPKVVPIFYASDDPTVTAKLQDFVNKLGATQYWGVMQEYGVGAITGEPGIQLTPADDPPLIYDDADIQSWLANKLNAKDPAFPQPDANTIYAFFFPAGVTITTNGVSGGFPGDGGVYPEGGTDAGVPANAGQSCIAGGFGGYHGVDQAVNTGQAVYAVIARCPNIFGLAGVDATTGIASHELGEASSDPVSAYGHLDAAHSYWRNLIGGSEIGDMCAQQVGSFVKFTDSPYVVQRLWSNKAAVAGTDPCVPMPTGEVYFNTIPNLPDTVQASGRGPDGGTTTIPTKAVQIAVGSSKTIELDLFSTAPTSAPWKIVALDEYQVGFAATKQLTLAPSITVGENGSKINLSITVNSAGSRNLEPFLITSTAQDGTQHMWAGLVSQ